MSLKNHLIKLFALSITILLVSSSAVWALPSDENEDFVPKESDAEIFKYDDFEYEIGFGGGYITITKCTPRQLKDRTRDSERN